MLGVFLFWVGCPLSHGWRRASVSAAASGAVCQWQTSSTDRRGSGDRPLGNVPPGRSGPQGGSQVGAPPKACRKLSLASPLGGRWCPVGTVQRLTEPAGESGLALARTERASCQRPPRMGCVEALAGGPLSRLTATAPPRGEPSLASPFGARKKVPPRPQTQKKTPGNTGCLASYRESAAVLDPHVPRADALLGAGQGPAKKFCPSPDAKKDTRRHRMSCFL